MTPDDDDERPTPEELSAQFRLPGGGGGDDDGAEPEELEPDEPTHDELVRLWDATDPEERRERLRGAAIGEVASQAWALLVAGLHEQGVELGSAPVILGDGLLVTDDGQWARDPEDEEEDDERADLVEALEEAMEERGLTATAVARRLSVSPSAVRSWLGGRALPAEPSCRAVERFLAGLRRARRPGRAGGPPARDA